MSMPGVRRGESTPEFRANREVKAPTIEPSVVDPRMYNQKTDVRRPQKINFSAESLKGKEADRTTRIASLHINRTIPRSPR